MLKYFIFFLFLQSTSGWTPGSWRTLQKNDKQMPVYPSKEILENVETILSKKAPLVSADECHLLKKEIKNAGNGKAFLFMGGDCAESFEQFSTNHVRDLYKLMLQIGVLLSYTTGLPTVKVARLAGQFAKPRSYPFETLKNGTEILSYKGDIINDIDIEKRVPDPNRMLDAYHQSTQTLNLLRAFTYGGYSDVHRLDHWRLRDGFLTENSYYRNINLAVRFMNALRISDRDPVLTQTDIFTCHECLLLPYEEALTREDSISKKIYDCSSHFLWVGERTRNLDSPHVEFLSGVENPIGIKISDKCSEDELIMLIKKLNPNNDYGKITLITRFGAHKIKDHLPRLIQTIKDHHIFVTWCCDPMHGNTKTVNKTKTRLVDDIFEEVVQFFEIHHKHGTCPGGIHVEMTPELVTECIDFDKVTNNTLHDNYVSKCDPRLNSHQILKLIEDFADFYFEKFI